MLSLSHPTTIRDKSNPIYVGSKKSNAQAEYLWFGFGAFILCYLKVKIDQKINKEENLEAETRTKSLKSNHKKKKAIIRS